MQPRFAIHRPPSASLPLLKAAMRARIPAPDAEGRTQTSEQTDNGTFSPACDACGRGGRVAALLWVAWVAWV